MLAAVPSMPPADLSPTAEKQPQTIAVNSVKESKLSSAPAAPRATRKSRPLRRRRRGGAGEDSEDEIMREAGSGTESDDSSHLEESATDSEGEEDVVVPESVTSAEHPATSSAVAAVEEKEALVEGILPVKTEKIATAAVLAPPNWSDMVTTELDGGDSSLPVIDFADFGASASTHTPPLTSAPTPPDVSAEEAVSVDASVPLATDATERQPAGTPRSVSARQAYLERLNNDPSFIPRVGAFWGHDDRLLDKGLRSMSPWWRDRQMAFRGRGGMGGRGGFEGGGFGFRGRGRGRGGLANYGGRGEAEEPPAPAEGEAGPSEAPEPPVQPPVHPADLPWSHDGYEEMRRVEVQRQQAYRGRGRGFNPNFRGRGFRGGPPPFVNGQHRTADASTTSEQSQSQSQPHPGPKQWVKRPEKPWTKEFAGHLYTDPSLKPRHDRGAGIRLKFPGSPDEGVIVRLPLAGEAASKSGQATSGVPKGKKEPTVRLPGSAKKSRKEAVSTPVEGGDFAQTMGQLTVGTPPPVEVVVESTTVLVKETVVIPAPVLPPPVSEPSASLPAPVVIPSTAREAAVDPVYVLERQFEQLSMDGSRPEEQKLVNGQTATQGFAPSPVNPPTEASSDASQSVHPGHAPPPQSIQMPPIAYPPQYPYGMMLPPGIAMDENGVCYEVATGRVVILHQPTPPPLYNPRPVSHVGPPGFIPPHVRALQNPSPDGFIPSPYSMTPDGGRPLQPEAYPYPGNEQGGMPFFAQRRSSGPVSIRSPLERHGSTSSATKSTAGAEGSGSLLRAAVHAPEFRPGGQMVAQQPQYVNRVSYFPTWSNEAVSPQRMNPRDGAPGAPMLPDDPAIVGREPMMVQDPNMAPQYPYYVDPVYGYGQAEYPYTPYGYEADGYGAPVDGASQPGATVYY